VLLISNFNEKIILWNKKRRQLQGAKPPDPLTKGFAPGLAPTHGQYPADPLARALALAIIRPPKELWSPKKSLE